MNMKKLFIAIVAAVGALTTNAQHQEKARTLLEITTHALTITNSATSNYVQTATTPVTSDELTGQNTVGVLTKIQYNGAGSTACIFKFSRSVDGTNFESTPGLLITNTPNGATATYTFTPMTVSGAKYIKLETIVNGSAAAITNGFVKIFPAP
jgi:hypothetical protein